MNKTRKLFCAAILLLSVACKDAPMTEPSPYKGLEYVYQKQGKKLFVGLQDTTGTPVIPIQFDSIRPGFDDKFLIGWKNRTNYLFFKHQKNHSVFLLAGELVDYGLCLERGHYYEIMQNDKFLYLFINETDKDEFNFDWKPLKLPLVKIESSRILFFL